VFAAVTVDKQWMMAAIQNHRQSQTHALRRDLDYAVLVGWYMQLEVANPAGVDEFEILFRKRLWDKCTRKTLVSCGTKAP